jgi:integrase
VGQVAAGDLGDSPHAEALAHPLRQPVIGKPNLLSQVRDHAQLLTGRAALRFVHLVRGRLDPSAGGVYLFVIGKGPNAGQRMERNNVWRDFDAIRRKAGLPKCSMHDLRRSFCTNLSRAMPMHVVQELAGHSDIRTTRRFYVQVEPELMQRACRALETALDEAMETENGSE